MEPNKHVYFITALSLATTLSANVAFADNNAQLTPAQATKLANEAYIYAYPLITMDITRQVMTNVASPQTQAAPMGQFANIPVFPDASFKTVTAPNADTLYSAAWLDLAKGPYVLHVPDEHGRYYLMPMLDAWTNVFASPGSRTTGTQEHNFAIVGPNWNGTLPAGVTKIKAPTNLVWILGRTYSSGTPDDLTAVHAIQAQYTLTPLSQFGKSYTPPTNVPTNSNVDMKTPPRDQVNAMDAQSFFNQVAMLMQNNPPSKSDKSMVKDLKKLGIIAGQPFDMSKENAVIAQALQQSTKTGLQQIVENIKNIGHKINGWQIQSLGTYGTDYFKRATITFAGLGANLPQDAMYPTASIDANGKPLNGANNYVMHFNKGDMPPVNGFWSLTMYDQQFYFVPNAINRYNLGTKDAFKYNDDGSLDIYIQHASPGTDKDSNWLPAPLGDFNITLRVYWPKLSIIDGKWNPPAVQEIK